MKDSSVDSKPNSLTVEEKYKIVRSVGDKCIQEAELMDLLAKKPQPICYDAFEPSGRMYIAQPYLSLTFLLGKTNLVQLVVLVYEDVLYLLVSSSERIFPRR